MTTVIDVEHLSKSYRLGQIGTGTLAHDLNVWWAKLRGKPNPMLKIGQEDFGNPDGEAIWALRDVSFTVQEGEVLGIIGRNGAGKSTLLKILSRVTAPTEGRIRLKGRVASLLEVGTGFHPELTGRENIYLNGAILGMNGQEIDRKFDQIVAFAEVEKFIDTPVKRYSSGMYVRLAFAVAAHLDAEILIVDEVLAVGDAEFQKKCLGKMGDVAAQEGRTVLFVSHNMGSIIQLCNEAILLNNGYLENRDRPDRIISDYLAHRCSENSVPGIETDEFKLIQYRVYQNENFDTTFFVTSKPIFIEFQYQIKKNVRGFRIGFDVISREGNLVFRSFHDDVQGPRIIPPGSYQTTCVIEGNFLNAVNYSLSPRITIHRQKWIYNGPYAINISINNPDGINSSYDEYRPGYLLPGLSWQTDRMDY